ncbi:MAG: chromate reductase [Candidatus Latescibacterota bacterium]
MSIDAEALGLGIFLCSCPQPLGGDIHERQSSKNGEKMSADDNGLRIAVIKGSVRPGNYTGMAVDLVVEELREKGVEVDVIDPVGMDLKLPGMGDSRSADELQELIAKATGVVLATPEYHGSYSAAIKLVIENMGFPSKLAGKPVALLGVAAGQIGAIKALEHLRSVASHVGAIVLPGPVSVAGVQDAFAEDGRCLDARVEKRVRALATNLLDYIHESVCPRATLEAFVRERA